MPKLYEYAGIVFYFYANEHLPIHVHASYGEYETIFELLFEQGALAEIRTRKSKGIEPLPPVKLKEAKKFVKVYAEAIADKWTAYFVKNARIESERITEKL
jgi:hypothetical protein